MTEKRRNDEAERFSIAINFNRTGRKPAGGLKLAKSRMKKKFQKAFDNYANFLQAIQHKF